MKANGSATSKLDLVTSLHTTEEKTAALMLVTSDTDKKPSGHCPSLHQLKTFLLPCVTWEPNPTVSSGNLQFPMRLTQTPAHPHHRRSDLAGAVGGREGSSCQMSFRFLGTTEVTPSHQHQGSSWDVQVVSANSLEILFRGTKTIRFYYPAYRFHATLQNDTAEISAKKFYLTPYK